MIPIYLQLDDSISDDDRKDLVKRLKAKAAEAATDFEVVEDHDGLSLHVSAPNRDTANRRAGKFVHGTLDGTDLERFVEYRVSVWGGSRD
jgi:hypothetical protein